MYRGATQRESKCEERDVDNFNSQNLLFRAWVIMAPPKDDPDLGFIFRLNTRPISSLSGKPLDDDDSKWAIPKIGEACTFLIHGESCRELCQCPHLSAKRMVDFVKLPRSWARLIEFKVLIPSHLINSKRSTLQLRPLAASGDNLSGLVPRPETSIKVGVQLRWSNSTCVCELETLTDLMKAGTDSSQKQTFEYLVRFNNPAYTVNLFDKYPHMLNLEQINNAELRSHLQEEVGCLDVHQKEALDGLGRIPHGVYFVPGGPGAGKTRWVLTVAALAQAATDPVKILYLQDTNKGLDDTADRMHRLSLKYDLGKLVIRMHKFPKYLGSELIWSVDAEKQTRAQPRSEDATNGDHSGVPTEQVDPVKTDLTEAFIAEWERSSMHQKTGRFGQDTKAPTLSEAVWNHYQDWKDCYPEIRRGLDEIAEARANGNVRPIINLHETLLDVYSLVLHKADFIAATPVAARRHMKSMFQPDLVIFDEAGHARELSAMVGIALFQPDAFIMTGDYRQSRPFVPPNYIYEPWSVPLGQLRVSLMERAAKSGAVTHQLLINHRAYGNLHLMPSRLFYQGEMESAIAKDDRFPPTVRHLRSVLSAWRLEDENSSSRAVQKESSRLLVNFEDLQHEHIGRSSWNARHQAWVCKRTRQLLKDPEFQQVGSSEPGTIMILSPYKESMNQYQAKISELSLAHQQRVDVRTATTAQGHEADVIFVDMVQDVATLYTDDPTLLCVAVTRARQAEIILMRKGMAYSTKRSIYSDGPVFTKKVWEYCVAAGQKMDIPVRA